MPVFFLGKLYQKMTVFRCQRLDRYVIQQTMIIRGNTIGKQFRQRLMTQDTFCDVWTVKRGQAYRIANTSQLLLLLLTEY